MLRRFTAPLAITLALLAPTVVFAQGAQQPQISYEAITSAPEGAWAEYVTTVKGQTQKITMRYALVEKTAKKMALEIDGQTPMGPIVMRMEFVPGAKADEWKVSAAKMAMGGQPPQDMPVPADTPPLKKGDMGTPVSSGAVKTPVGTFDCKEYKKTIPQGTVNLWMSDKVQPVGLVKQELGEGQLSTLLSAVGTGAKSKMPASTGKSEPSKSESKPAKK